MEVAERYADSLAAEEELERAAEAACEVWDEELERASTGGDEPDEQDEYCPQTPSLAAYNIALPVGWWGAAPAFVAPDKIARQVAASDMEGAAQCELLRDIFDNPFRPPPAIDSAWRTWNIGLILKLAESAYRDRIMPQVTFDPEKLGVLADALEKAGCADPRILEHLREAGPHVRGCWVVDLLLGKS